MKMNHATMYSRLVASDPTWNGRFFTGVKTTGIYCLPSCRARKPKSENVTFFPTCEAARAAGFRACLKCHPDDFARGADPVLETVEALVAEIRAEPGRFRDARAVVQRSGFGTTRCFELFRQHYHSTPADLLLRARVETARRLLSTGGQALVDVAGDAGFDSLSGFHEAFRTHNGMTPADYRRVGTADTFTVGLPSGYSLPHLFRVLGRDPQSVTERLQGHTYECSATLEGKPALLTLDFTPESVAVRVEAGPAATAGQRFAAHRVVIGLIGLEQDAAAFARLARRLGLGRLVAHRPGLRIVQTPSVLDGLLWSIIGQQINLAFACQLKRRLIENTGAPLRDGFFSLPTAEAIAQLTPAQMKGWQYSQKKAEYVVGTARLIAEGTLKPAALAGMSATRAERTLLAIHGLGPWSVNYVMMRALGFADCVPLGDTGVTSGLKKLFRLEERPDVDGTRRLMTVFSPHRSLATAHLWQLNHPDL
jgi:AraC family transcriptional regulator, regulatory protein of adaptative response / DNA-3-methyladenine glycosylase II